MRGRYVIAGRSVQPRRHAGRCPRGAPTTLVRRLALHDVAGREGPGVRFVGCRLQPDLRVPRTSSSSASARLPASVATGPRILTDRTSLPMVAGLAVGTVSAALVGGLLSWIAVRRSLGVIFTGIVTLVFSLAFYNLLLGRRDLTGVRVGSRRAGGSRRPRRRPRRRVLPLRRHADRVPGRLPCVAAVARRMGFPWHSATTKSLPSSPESTSLGIGSTPRRWAPR